MDPQMNPNSSSEVYRQLSVLTNDLANYKSETNKKFDKLNVRSSFQLSSINERLNVLETRFQSLSQEVDELKVSSSMDLANKDIKKKIDLIGQHMADLSSDITKLSPSTDGNSTNHGNTGNAGTGSGSNAGSNIMGPVNDSLGSHMSNSSLASSMAGSLSVQSTQGSQGQGRHGDGRHGEGRHGDVQAQARAQVQAQVQAQVNAQVQAQARAQARVQAEQAQAQAHAHAAAAQAEVDAQTQADIQAQVESQARAQARAQAQAQARVQAQEQAQAQAQAQAAAVEAVQAAVHDSTSLTNMSSVSPASNNVFDSVRHDSLQQSTSSRPLISSIPSYSGLGFMDINKQWSKALGIRSPGIESPFIPKQMNFDYPIPINRALSFNRSLDETNLAAASAANANAVSAIAGTPTVLPSGITEESLGPSGLADVTSSSTIPGNSNTEENSSNSASSDNMVKPQFYDGLGPDLQSKSMVNGFGLIDNDSPTLTLKPDESPSQTQTQPQINQGHKRRKSSKSSESSDHASPPTTKKLDRSDYPQYKLEKGSRNVIEIWQEYEYGVKGKPPLKELEEKFNARWRNETESRTFVRRKKIYTAIERGIELGYTEEEVVKELESLRTYDSNGTVKKKPMSWLYSNIPEKFRDPN